MDPVSALEMTNPDSNAGSLTPYPAGFVVSPVETGSYPAEPRPLYPQRLTFGPYRRASLY